MLQVVEGEAVVVAVIAMVTAIGTGALIDMMVAAAAAVADSEVVVMEVAEVMAAAVTAVVMTADETVAIGVVEAVVQIEIGTIFHIIISFKSIYEYINSCLFIELALAPLKIIVDISGTEVVIEIGLTNEDCCIYIISWPVFP